jgi:hypothetical protein
MKSFLFFIALLLLCTFNLNAQKLSITDLINKSKCTDSLCFANFAKQKSFTYNHSVYYADSHSSDAIYTRWNTAKAKYEYLSFNSAVKNSKRNNSVVLQTPYAEDYNELFAALKSSGFKEAVIGGEKWNDVFESSSYPGVTIIIVKIKDADPVYKFMITTIIQL